MRLSEGVSGSRILSLGEYSPTRVVPNEEICARLDSSDEWIRTRSGIVTRRIAGPDETVVDMAQRAGHNAMCAAGLSPEDIDLVIVATSSLPYQTPGAAAEVAHRIGITAPGAMDITAGCAGFCYALSVASDAVRTGNSACALVIGSERPTDMVDPDDRSMAFLFGDGAGAAIVGRSEEPGIGPVVWGSDGSKVEAIAQRPTFAQLRAEVMAGGTAVLPMVRMDGVAVFRWATAEVAKVAARALDAAGVAPHQLGAFVPHQANLRIIESVARALRLPKSVAIARDIVHRGNTSTASIPLALHGMLERREVKSGQPALFVGFGAGLTYAGQVALIP
ncbi:ketoacyl-ACP synthase III [Actinomadura darangshiensis]|uniref:Beta-ketoacyl-[acyl-carrier-protein] synthase III n=1 Tax=Actinomadura darangshiensis TaxID=705336 RepID=A0A4R5C285_9ACTN|nr:beta-ketoacyl-ACP synthase III [Actinomadura darangshiensis]TDD92915.1 ketoacyl-ACP synthase III [Actinomadura darangshiensis]